MSTTSQSSSRNATRRLIKELEIWNNVESKEEKGIERLGPVNEGELLAWEAVINGRGVGAGYDGSCLSPVAFLISLLFFFFLLLESRKTDFFHCVTEGRWLLQITIPAQYPLSPPAIRFATPIVHANVALRTGEICLDLLKDAWTPAYSVLECVRAVRMLLSCPGIDSPLNVDVAALLREGDALGARRLVEFWVRDEGGRYNGP
jgi:peroxin-4